MSQLVRELKRKRDEEARLAQRSPLPVFQETESGQTIKAPEQVVVEAVTALNNLKNAVNIAAGDNISIAVNGQTITITGLDNILTGTVEPTSLMAGTLGQFYLETFTPKLYICTAISEGTYTWTEVGAGDGGVSYTLPQATESELGGVKAKARTTETAEIAIDEATGRLYGTAPDEAANGLPTGGEAGQVLAKASPDDYDAEWIDAPSGGGGVETFVLFDPGTIASSRTETGVTDYVQALNSFSILGGYYHTDWIEGVTYTFKVWDNAKTLLASVSIVGDGSINARKLLLLETPLPINVMEQLYLSLEQDSGSIKKYYGDVRPSAFVLKHQSYSGLPDGTLSVAANSYSTGILIQL